MPATTQAGGTQPTFVTEQPSDQWSARVFLGETVTNDTGDNIGTVSDLLFDQGGGIKTAVLNVGGLLGVGGKSVAVPFGALSVSFGATGERVIKVSITKDAINAAPDYKPTEKTVLMKAQEKASEVSDKAMEKAGELKDQAVKKIEEMRKEEPTQ
jgi:sporulation protein YlmC with PRC-barrel domain